MGNSATVRGSLAPKYEFDRKVACINDSGAGAIKRTVTEYFKWDDRNVGSSNDKMKWLRFNLTPSQYVDEIVAHLWTGERSLVLPAVTSDGRFRLVDIMKDGKRLKISTDVDSDIRLLNKGILNSSSGDFNRIYGNTRGFKWDSDSGDTSTFNPTVTPTYGKKFNQLAYNNNFDKMYLDLGNTHSKYMEANTMRGTLLNNFSCNEIICEVLDLNVLDVLDQVDLVINNDPAQGESNDLWSGRYVVSKITTTVHNSQYSTWVTLNLKVFLANHGDW